ncbi:MAG: class I SAM-dependent DNA methyltransferase [Acidimicrobiales bacterium]
MGDATGPTEPTGGFEPLDPALDAAMSLDGDVDRLRRHYDRWAPAYDGDVGADEYSLPNQVALLLNQIVAQDQGEPIAGLTIDPAPPDPEIIDIGCGTGLIGQRLTADGYRSIDGIDLSPAMIEVAEGRGSYRSLRGGIDITAPLPDDLVGRYDVAVAGGVFTVGHVPPSALRSVAAMVRPGGLAIVTTRHRYYETSDYQAESDRLEVDRVLALLRVNRDAPYTLDSPGHYWAYSVIG